MKAHLLVKGADQLEGTVSEEAGPLVRIDPMAKNSAARLPRRPASRLSMPWQAER